MVSNKTSEKFSCEVTPKPNNNKSIPDYLFTRSEPTATCCRSTLNDGVGYGDDYNSDNDVHDLHF